MTKFVTEAKKTVSTLCKNYCFAIFVYLTLKNADSFSKSYFTRYDL